MGDKTWHFIDCPKCGGKGTVECFEHDSAELKLDTCSECDYIQRYDYEEIDGVIHITEVTDLVATDQVANTSPSNPQSQSDD